MLNRAAAVPSGAYGGESPSLCGGVSDVELQLSADQANTATGLGCLVAPRVAGRVEDPGGPRTSNPGFGERRKRSDRRQQTTNTGRG
jgi:hypothetical protein